MFQRGPATNMRDSIQVQRRDSPEPSRVMGGYPGGGSRPPSRDPSPKTGPGRRNESPSQKGKPPPRYVSPAGSRRTGGPTSAPPGSGAYPPTAPGRPPIAAQTAPGGGYPSYPGFSLSGVRTGSAPPAPGAATPPPGGGPPRGMTAFRSGGPVRAKADVIGADGASARRSRPVQQTTAPTRAGSTSRPASPLGAQQRSGSQSRPASPTQRSARSNSRPASPGTVRSAQPATHSAPPTMARTVPAMQGASYPHAQTQRSLSGHMRRAPSPTPAFNRNPSPSKPRWRA